MRHRASVPLAPFALLAVAVAAATAGATDTVDLQIGGAANVKGTIRDATERERFLMELPAGTTLRAVAKPKGKLAPVPTLDFVDGADVAVATGTTKKRTASIQVPAVVGSGLYRLRLTGDGVSDGDYQLQVAPKHRKTFTGSGTVPAAALPALAFAAPAGSTARIEVKPAKGSAFVPSLDSVKGPGTFVLPLAGGGKAGPLTLGPGGDYTVQLTNAGGDGDYTWKVTVTAPRGRPSKIDITARALSGEFTYGQPVLGREVGSEGAFLDPSAEGVPLGGTSLDIPPGALATPTVLTVAESTPFLLAAGVNATGPAIRFGPSGTQFAIPATVTIPYDPAAYADPATEMTIYILNETTGEVEEAPKPYDFSGPAGTVTFPTSHFSTFLSTNTRPRTITGNWVWIRTRGSAQAAFGGSQSVVVGDVTFDPAGGWFASGYGPASQWGTNDGNGMPFVSQPGDSLPFNGSWFVASDQQVDLSDASQNQYSFRRGASGDAMVEIPAAPAPSPEVFLSALLRRPPGGATPATTVGTWHFVHVSARGFSQFDSVSGLTTLSLDGTSIGGRVTFTADGKANIQVEGTPFDAQTPFPTGTWMTKGNLEAPPSTWSAFGDVYLYIGGTAGQGPRAKGAPYRTEKPSEVPPVRLLPVLGGDVMVGIDGDSFEGDGALMVLVRASSDASKGLLAGQFDLHDFETTLRDAPLPTPGFVFAARYEAMGFDGLGTAGGSGRYGPSVSHDPQGLTTMVYDSPDGTDPAPGPFTYRVASDGLYTDGRGLRGAVTRDGHFLVGLQSVRSAGLWRLVLGFRRPAGKT